MKKALFSVLALLLATAMVVSFAACGGNEEPETTTVPNVEADATESGDIVEGDTTAAEGDTTVADETTAADATTDVDATADANATTVAGETTTAAGTAIPQGPAAIVALYNEATAKAVSAKPGYKKTVTTKLNDLKMGALAKIDLVRETVGDFLGEGTETATVAKGKASKEIVKSTLTAADVANATCKLSADGKYYEVTITVKNEKNPLKGKSALNRFTNDYKDINEMRAGLEEAGAAVETIDITVKTATIKAKIAVDTKAFSSVDYTISSDAYLTNVKYTIAKVKVVTGNIYTTVKYSGFAY
ncbi:MAG: hypothetical protein IJA87_03305 [Clostridia bacterium]|nr:hypothetical protein [Clostridia bacterium]